MNRRGNTSLRAGLALVLMLLACLANGPDPARAASKKCDLNQPLPAALHQALFEAHQLYDKGEYQQALNRLKPGHQGTGLDHYRLFFMRGLLNFQLNRPTEAEADLARAVALKPCFFQAVYNLAAVQYQSAEYPAAAQSALKAFELSDPPDWDILYLASVALLSAKQPARAEALLTRLADRPKAKPEWLRALIQALVDQHKRGPAKERIKQFLDRRPGRAEMWRLLANLETADKRYAPAAAALEVALALDGGREGERLELAGLFQAAGAPLRAAEQYRLAYGPQPGPDQLDKLARLYYQARRFDLARPLLRRALAGQPSPERYSLLAEVNLQLRDYSAARRAFVRAAQGLSGPAAAGELIRAAHCALRLERYNLAAQDFSGALKAAGPDRDLARQAREGRKTARRLADYWRKSD